MDVSAQTLREVQFREKLRGYHPDDVDEFLERVAAGLEYLQDRLRQAVERAQRAEQRVAEGTQGDDALRRTLVLAQRTAELAVQEAREEAERISASARAEARAIVAQAEEAARRAIDDAQGGLRAEVGQLEAARDQLRADIGALERHLDAERARLRDALTAALHAVDEQLPPLAPPPDPSTPEIPPLRVPSISLPTEFSVGAFTPATAAPAAPEVPEVPEAGHPPSPSLDPETVLWAPFDPDRDDYPQPSRPAAIDQATSEPSEEEEPASAEPSHAELGAAAPAPEAASLDDDPFIAELRRAITDTEPLGPRDEDDDDPEMGPGSGELRDGDLLDAGRLGSLLRRRR